MNQKSKRTQKNQTPEHNKYKIAMQGKGPRNENHLATCHQM